jgi:tetratricopeptide (TPR) repeat protein
LFSQNNDIIQLYNNEEYDKIVIILEEKLRNANSLSEKEYFYLGLSYHILMSYGNAIHNFEILSEFQPENIKYLLALGNSQSEFGDLNSARINYAKVLSIDSRNRIAMIRLGKTLIELNEFENAAVIYEKSINIDPQNSYFYYQLGLCKFRSGKISLAKMNFEKSISLNNLDPQIFLILSRIYFDEGELENSMEVLKKGLLVSPKNKRLNKRLADLLYHQNRYHEAILKYLYNITIGDTSSNIYQKLGMAYYYLSFTASFINSDIRNLKLFEGVKALKKAIKNDEKDPINFLYLGLCYKELDSNKLAIKYLQESLNKSIPDYLSEIYFNLGISYDKENKLVESIKAYQKSIRSNPSKSIVYFYLANLYDRYYQDKSVAVIYYQKFVKVRIDEDEKLVAYAEKRIEDLNRELKFWNN